MAICAQILKTVENDPFGHRRVNLFMRVYIRWENVLFYEKNLFFIHY